jgi:ABC-type multidrug transport system fused ATPase/permease subunit
MIAHRIETLEKCDRIIVLKNDKSYQILEPKEFFAMRAAQEFFK